jgi:hypothetical protein
MTDAELLEQKRTQLAEINAAITRVLTGAQEHSLDTGHTRQGVKYASFETLTEERARLEADIATHESRLGCGSIVNVTPGF